MRANIPRTSREHPANIPRTQPTKEFPRNTGIRLRLVRAKVTVKGSGGGSGAGLRAAGLGLVAHGGGAAAARRQGAGFLSFANIVPTPLADFAVVSGVLIVTSAVL